jgi:membrane associated rhomboid family serine protease
MNVTLAIIIATCLLSFPAFGNAKMLNDLLFWPYRIARNGEYHRFLSGGAVHADSLHLMFNMLSLYSFGLALEQYFFPSLFGGQSRLFYALLYVTAIVFASLPDYFRHRNDSGYRALGASGAVSAVIYSAITIQPSMPIRFFFIPIDIPGYLFGFIFLALSYQLARKGGGNIGHNAHFWGAVYGVVFTVVCARLFAGVDLIDRFARLVF